MAEGEEVGAAGLVDRLEGDAEGVEGGVALVGGEEALPVRFDGGFVAFDLGQGLADGVEPGGDAVVVRGERLGAGEEDFGEQQVVEDAGVGAVALGDDPQVVFDEDALMLEAIRHGARRFLLKDVSLERLAEAIRTVAGGGTLIQPAVTERILRAALDAGHDFPALDPPDPLTEREVEVLRLMTGGCSNREIADALHVAEGTVKNHISSILSKLGVRDRTRAVLKGLELGLI